MSHLLIFGAVAARAMSSLLTLYKLCRSRVLLMNSLVLMRPSRRLYTGTFKVSCTCK